MFTADKLRAQLSSTRLLRKPGRTPDAATEVAGLTRRRAGNTHRTVRGRVCDHLSHSESMPAAARFCGCDAMASSGVPMF